MFASVFFFRVSECVSQVVHPNSAGKQTTSLFLKGNECVSRYSLEDLPANPTSPTKSQTPLPVDRNCTQKTGVTLLCFFLLESCFLPFEEVRVGNVQGRMQNLIHESICMHI